MALSFWSKIYISLSLDSNPGRQNVLASEAGGVSPLRHGHDENENGQRSVFLYLTIFFNMARPGHHEDDREHQTHLAKNLQLDMTGTNF